MERTTSASVRSHRYTRLPLCLHWERTFPTRNPVTRGRDDISLWWPSSSKDSMHDYLPHVAARPRRTADGTTPLSSTHRLDQRLTSQPHRAVRFGKNSARLRSPRQRPPLAAPSLTVQGNCSLGHACRSPEPPCGESSVWGVQGVTPSSRPTGKNHLVGSGELPCCLHKIACWAARGVHDAFVAMLLTREAHACCL